MSVSPQRPAARVLQFASPSLTRSLDDRLERLREVNPEGAAMLERLIDAMCGRVERD